MQIDSTLAKAEYFCLFGGRVGTPMHSGFPRRIRQDHGDVVECDVEFIVEKPGVIKDLRFPSRSQSRLFDDLVTEAIFQLNGNPILKFPARVPDKSVSFRMKIKRSQHIDPRNGKFIFNSTERPSVFLGI